MNKTQITTFLASTALLSAVFVTPAFADTDIRVSGNGSFSDNSVSVNEDNSTTVRQTNDTTITNDVSVNNNTGHNSASGNTGGDVNIRTGDATSDVTISNQAGMNVANINGCCDSSDTNVKIEGNGAWSDNRVDISKDSNLRVTQNNDTNIHNDVNVHNNTGNNSADDNTWGDVSIDTGDASSNVSIRNEAGKNVLDLNGCCTGGDTHVSIFGNGSGSDNRVVVNSDNNRTFSQNNDTDFHNDVDVHNNTGYNNAASSNYWWNWDGMKDHSPSHDRDYGKDKHYFPFVKHYTRDYDKDYDHKTHDYDRYDFKKISHDKDQDKHFYPFVKYMKYDDGYKKDYDRNHDYIVYHKDYDHDNCYDRCDHSLSYFPKFKFMDSNRCDYDHWKDWNSVDWKWFKDNCQQGKSYDAHRMVYLKHYSDYDDYDHKKYDRDYKKLSYDHDRDHNKKYFGGNTYSLVKYPLIGYHKNYCDDGYKGKNTFSKYGKDFYPFFGHGGNTGGSVSIRTGDASGNVHLNNLGSSNYLSV